MTRANAPAKRLPAIEYFIGKLNSAGTHDILFFGETFRPTIFFILAQSG